MLSKRTSFTQVIVEELYPLTPYKKTERTGFPLPLLLQWKIDVFPGVFTHLAQFV